MTTRIDALRYPDAATTMKQIRAIVEYRGRMAARRSGASRARSSVTVTSPPSQKPANSTCSQIAVTASSWLAVSPAWPSRASGIRPSTARATTNPSAVTLRTAKHSTVTAAPSSVVMSHARPGEVWVRKTPRPCPYASSRLIGM